MFNLTAANPVVTVDTSTGRPREIRTDDQRLVVTGLEMVREETAAYPADLGPRTVFVVRADGRRFRLTHRLWDRLWAIEELVSQRSGLTRAA